MPKQKQPLWSRSAAAALAISLGIGMAACRHADTESLIAEARQYRARGEIQAAVIQLKTALQQDGDHRAARVLLGEVYIEQGDAISADKELRRALALGADTATVHPLLGRAMLMQGQFERLLGEIRPAAGAAQGPAILALRANALMGLADVSQARELFKQALTLAPAFPDALLGLARIALAERQPEQARTLLAQALAASPSDIDCLRFSGDLLRGEGKSDAAMAAYRKILALRPNNAQAHIDVANIHIDQAHYKEARAAIEAARKVSVGTVSVFYSGAMLDFREGKHGAALEALQQILSAAPDHTPSILLIGAVQSALGANQQAEQHLRTFLLAYPRHLYASKLMASLHVRNNNAGAAMALLRPLLLEYENDAELLALAGEAQLRVHHFSSAADYFERASALRPETAQLHAALAMSRLGNGENGRAVAELERAARLDTRSTRTGVLLAMTYLRAGNPDKALQAALEMEKQGDNPLIQNLKGGIFLAKQDARSARASFERALAIDGLYMAALDNLAQLDAMERRPGDAAQRYQAALDKAPHHAGIMEALARLATSEGKTALAMDWLEKASKSKPDDLALAMRLTDFYARAGEKHKAVVLAQKLQASNPSNPDTLAMLAQVYHSNANFTAAAETYTRLAALAPRAAMPHMRLATLRLGMRDEGAALASLRRALLLEPDLLDAQLTLLNLYIGQKKFAEARALAAGVQRRRPEAAAGYKLEGDVLSAQGRHLPALKAYERAFALQRGGPQLMQVHGALLKAGKASEADARMALWFKDYPADVPTRLYYASSKLVNNERQAAILHLEAVLKVDPKNIVALNDLAWTYQQLGDKHALAYAERAYALAPNSPAIMDTLGWIYLESGNIARALPLLQKASALAPNAGEIRYHLAMVLARSGDKRGARRELERALASPNAFPRRAEAKALLASL